MNAANSPQTKLCPSCRRKQPIDAFALRERGGTARQSWCRACFRDIKRANRATDLLLSDDPAALSVEEVAIATLVIAATTPPVTSTPGDLANEAVDTWRVVYPLLRTAAAGHGLTLTQPVGWPAASQVLAEANAQIPTETETT
ncbi:hypothetical protein M3672_09175 [Microbacterium enclense]|uniref:hypothetical protein n=1 Tax=Microbacterium enclense TaxID=993073 RepID=UPI00203B87A2|nr:hypothetical protein [Microbacterium enclense]MCM3614607.1 hypothetical protein [Microbacterium enclense]